MDVSLVFYTGWAKLTRYRKMVTTQPYRAAGSGPHDLTGSLREPEECFLVCFENALHFQNTPLPFYQAAKPRFTEQVLRMSSYEK